MFSFYVLLSMASGKCVLRLAFFLVLSQEKEKTKDSKPKAGVLRCFGSRSSKFIKVREAQFSDVLRT